MDENPYQSPQTVDRQYTNGVRTPTFWRCLFAVGLTAFVFVIAIDASPRLRFILICLWFGFGIGALWRIYGSYDRPLPPPKLDPRRGPL